MIRRFRGIGRKRSAARGKVYRASPPARLSLINNLINSQLITRGKVKNGLSRKRRNIVEISGIRESREY